MRSKTRTIKASDARRIIAAEWNTWEQQDTLGQITKTNAQIAKELKITPILDKLLE